MGEIITFYSYKGGTGRTMAMANVAWILAAAGNRVLMVDWDLEAPGLHRYFYPFLRDKELVTSTGVMDIVMDFMVQAMTPPSSEQDRDKTWYLQYADVLRHAVSIDWDFGKGQLDLLPAGRQNASYATQVNSFNWDNFYERLGGGTFLEALRASMLREYEYVLIDSRTGVSDTSGICTVQLPDKIVVCFTLNRQSIEGAASVAHSIVEARARAGRLGTQVFPVPTRVEKAETLRLDAARAASRARFDGLLSHLPEDARQRYWDETEIAYQPFYAYEEVLASFGDASPRVGSLLHTMHRLAARLVGQSEIEWQAPPAEKRAQVLAQYGWPSAPPTPKPATQPTLESAPPRRSARRGSLEVVVRTEYSFFVSHARPDGASGGRPYLEAFVRDLGREVFVRTGDDTPWFIDLEDPSIGDPWGDRVAEALAGCRAAVCLVSPTYIRSESCGREFAALEHLGVSILPVWWVPVREPLPAPLRDRVFAGRQDPRMRRSGLHALMRFQRYEAIYRGLLQELAEPIALAPRPPPRGRVSWDETPNAFATSAQAMVGTKVVAACVPPMAWDRWDWRPFGSALISALTERAALEEGFTLVMTAFTPSFVDEIGDQIGLILAPTTIDLRSDAELLRQIDALNLPTLSVVVVEPGHPFIDRPRTDGSKPQPLEVLPRLASSHQVMFAGNEEELVLVIRQELVRMRGRVLQEGTAVRSADSLPRPVLRPARPGEDA
jgi:MinD-like ATPase involved in chromosome partitioning or flagellar assembly